MRKLMTIIAALAGLVVGGCSIKSVKTTGYRNVTTDVFESQTKLDNVQILDVRTKRGPVAARRPALARGAGRRLHDNREKRA